MTVTHLTGDCLEMLKTIPDGSVSLIITSPPYADARKRTYGGPAPDEYVEWFLPRALEFKRVLRPTGTFILNIKERVSNGARHFYVMDLVKALCNQQGWLWTEEWIWHKRNCAPGKWPNRFRDAWEHVFQFNLRRKFDMYQDEVRVPIGDWSRTRLANLSETDRVRDPSRTGSGFGKNVSHWVGRETVYPSNVLHLASECSNENHSAVFPRDLPSFFIRLFTIGRDTVLDPFEGSGTTGGVATDLRRHYIGVDLHDVNVEVAKRRIRENMGMDDALTEFG